MGFDLDAFREAHRPWSLTARGRSYPARWISGEEVLRFRAIWDAEADADAAALAVRRLLRALWPWRPWMLWRGDPVRLFRRATEVEQQTWLRDFFVHRAAAIAALEKTIPSTN